MSYPQSQSSLVFGPTLLPSNQVHVQVPANSDLASSFTAHVHGLPKQFVMGLTAVEFILQSSLTDQTLLQECLSSLTHTLQHLSLPAVLKEMIFHLAAGVTRKMVSKVDFPDDLHKALIEEFAVLYSEELLLFGHSGDMEFPSSKSIAAGGKGRFFTYTQSLFEVLHSLFYLHPIASHEESSQPAPTGRLSVYERPSRKISRPVPVKSLSYDPTVVRVTPPTTDSKWVNDIHDTLSVMEEIVASGEISLFDLEAGLMISPQSRLIVITGISPTPDTLDVLRGLASNHGGLYRDTLYSCEEGVVLETVHNGKVPPFSLSVWNCESLKTQKETEVCVFTVGENLKCENEVGAKVLSGFLANRLETKLIASLHGDVRAGKSRIVSELFEEDQVKEILSLSENEFVKKIREQKVEAVWRCLLSCGIDLHGDKYVHSTTTCKPHLTHHPHQRHHPPHTPPSPKAPPSTHTTLTKGTTLHTHHPHQRHYPPHTPPSPKAPPSKHTTLTKGTTLHTHHPHQRHHPPHTPPSPKAPPSTHTTPLTHPHQPILSPGATASI